MKVVPSHGYVAVFPFCHYGTSDYRHWQFFHRGNGGVVIGDFPIYLCLRMKWVLCGQFPIHHLLENASRTKHISPFVALVAQIFY
jgi:hypothetical protein